MLISVVGCAVVLDSTERCFSSFSFLEERLIIAAGGSLWQQCHGGRVTVPPSVSKVRFSPATSSNASHQLSSFDMAKAKGLDVSTYRSQMNHSVEYNPLHVLHSKSDLLPATFTERIKVEVLSACSQNTLCQKSVIIYFAAGLLL